MVNKYFKAILFVAFLLVSSAVMAQDGGPPPPDPDDLPIDGGIIGLVVVAIGYGAKKIHDNSKD